MAESQRVCVVGSGISGLSAAWLLHRRGAKVTLFESEHRPGGHTLTDDSPGYSVDLGFQVYNLTTYPNLVGLFEQLGVDSEPSDMSFALSMDGGALEWGSHGLHSIFAQRRNMLSPSFLRMIWDVIRFGQLAPLVLQPELARKYGNMSLGEYVHQQNYSQVFISNYLLPMCAAVWSVPNAQVMAFPVVMLVRFWVNHHLLDLTQRPVWRVVKDRSRTYVHKILEELSDVRLGCPVTSATPASSQKPALVQWGDGQSQEFDAVVFATHSDTTLSLLGNDAPKGVRKLLEAIPYGTNEVYLHTDEALMPRNHATWASWNCIGSSDPSADTQAVCVTYWLNNLQRLPAEAPPIFVTLNPPRPPAPDKTIRQLQMAHPVSSCAAYDAQQKLHTVQGEGGLYYAGAWCGYGFHEDGLKAGMAAAVALGAKIPWSARATCPKISLADSFFLGTFDRFARMAISLGSLRLILPNGEERFYGSRGALPPVPDEDMWLERPQLRATMRVFNMSVFRKIITRHDTGLGEAYMNEDYEVDDLGALIAVVTANAGNIEGKRGALGLLNRLGDWLLTLAHRARANTIEGSRRNIEEHYDAGNAMYKLFLDETMTYSSGIHRPGDSLKQAQLNKLDALIERANIKSTDHVLEIGCGWGSMAIHAVQKTGCTWTGVTVSKQQLEEAVARVKAAGLSDSIKLLFCDYREGHGLGTFDKVVSCEMIEAVGHENLPAYFQAISTFLKPGGQAVIQAISEPDERYEAYCTSSDFIREHIFPGGHLPSMGAMLDAARGTGLSVQDCADIGPHYAVTLRAWRAAWEREHDALLRLGYSERFWRKYSFYFAYCEAAFDAKYIHNFQILWEKSAEPQTMPPYLAHSPSEELFKPTGALLTPIQAAPSDPITQVLLAVYFFLAGCIVSQSRMMWVAPAASAFFACLFAAVSHASSMLSSTYRQLGRSSRAWWCADLVHMGYSAAVFLCAALYVLKHPLAFLITWSPPSAEAGMLPDVLVSVSAGFFGFQLWALVCTRLSRQSYLGVIHYTLLLMLFGAAAFKAVHTPLLTAMLLSELASLLCLAGKMQELTGGAMRAGLLKYLHTAELGSLLLFQLVPHFLIAVSVLVHPETFSAKSYYAIATAGCAYINASNVRKVIVCHRRRPKQHSH